MSKEESHGERLARLEEQNKQILAGTTSIDNKLSAYIGESHKREDAQNLRIAEVEKRSTKTETHLLWMKGIWLAVQGSVLAWLGLGK